ncbi:MAG: hypothetical protein J7513_01845 [Solirubrobacteraceae bacterium]|nr:hypothetical protein [Solirubrobacteraceae bacterium]
MLVTSSRRALAVFSCSIAAVGVAGCGSGDDSSGGGGGGSADGGDGAALLNAATITPDGAALKSGTVGLSVSGTFDSPKDKDVKKVSGKVSLTVSSEGIDTAKGSTPPTKVTFDIDGDYTSPSGKTGTAKYAGGFSYLDSQLYVNWKGKDYAFGKELTKQFATGFGQGLSSKGDSKDLQAVTADPKKLVDTLDLEPGTWLEDSKVSDGPELDGVATDAVTGKINVRATAEDLREGFKKLPAAFPNVPGFKELEQMGDLKDADIKEAEESLTTRDLTAYIGKEDHALRRLELKLAGKDKGDGGASADLTIQIDMTKFNQPQGIKAPSSSAPVTDLFAELQKDFPGIGGLLGG